jgi:hypothetical protein
MQIAKKLILSEAPSMRFKQIGWAFFYTSFLF